MFRRGCDTIGGKHGSKYERNFDLGVYGTTWASSGGSSYQWRGDSVCDGSGGYQHASAECSVFSYSLDELTNRTDNDV
jgi:hypothetical protein